MHQERHPLLRATTPGARIHVDVQKLGTIPDGGGWGYVGKPRPEL
jgi:hypothetical protein